MKSFLPTKLTLDDDQIGKALEKAANPQKVNDDFIAPAAEDPNVEQANDDTFLIDERMRSEAETVQKLPKTFPIEEWEKMTTKQQKKALEFSGLTEQEQWKILNVGAPLNALAHYPTRMYAMSDAKTNSGGPLKLEKTSTDDQEPRTTTPNNDDLVVIEMAHEPGSIEDQAHRDLYGWVESLNLDTGNLTVGQRKILDDAEKRMVSLAELGILTDAVKRDILIKTGNQIAALPSSAENPITIFVEMAEKPEQAPASVPPTEVQEKELTEEEKAIEAAKEINKQFKQEVYVELLDLSNETSRKGELKKKINMDLVNKAAKVLYEKSSKPIVIGKVTGTDADVTIPIGELISPYDNSFGAQLVREAMKLIGLEYGAKAKELVPGKNGGYAIDCSRLVSWALSQINLDWKKDTISTSARYQINSSEAVWTEENGYESLDDDLQVGDTLFWEGVETGNIVHTAIYIGNGLMIESGKGGVHIERVRESTHNNNGEDSKLVQANRMTPEGLYENLAENKRHKKREG